MPRTTELLGAALVAAVLTAGAGAAPKAPKPIKPDRSEEAIDVAPVLVEGEALIAFALDAESGVEYIKLQPVDEDDRRSGKPLTIRLKPETGYTVRVFKVRAAHYRLEQIKAEGAYGGRVTMYLKDPFVVEAGQLNYIGDIKLKRHDLHVDVTVDNRVGRFSGKLLETRRAIAEGFKLRYAGKESDDWSSAIFEGE